MTHFAFKTTLLLTAVTVGASLLAGCGDDGDDPMPPGTARFGAMTAAQREVAVELGAGGALIAPYFVMFGAELDSGDQAACPAREDVDGVVTLTGNGCTGASGATYEGRLIARNVPSFGDVFEEDPTTDPTQPMSITMEGFSVNGVIYDGVLEQSVATPADGQAYTTLVDYAVSGPEGGSYQLESECTGGQHPCPMTGFFETAQFGSFGVVMQAHLSSTASSGWIELRGEDTLRLDFDATVDNCVPYTIDGEAAGQVCQESQPPSEEPTVTVSGVGYGCSVTDDGFEHDVSAWVIGDAERVEVTALEVRSGAEETHAAVYESFEAETDEHTWHAVFGDAESALPCSEAGLTYKVTAHAADGTSHCYAVGPDAATYDADGCTRLTR